MKPSYWQYGIPLLLLFLVFFYVEGWLSLMTFGLEPDFLPATFWGFVLIFSIGTMVCALGTAAFSSILYYNAAKAKLIVILGRKKVSG
jgi:hypothetical protein